MSKINLKVDIKFWVLEKMILKDITRFVFVSNLVAQMIYLFVSCHEKVCLCHVQTTKVQQMSLRIRAVLSVPFLFAAYVVFI